MRATDLLFSTLYLGVLLIAFFQISGLNEFGSGVYSEKFYPQLIMSVGIIVGVVETIRVVLTKTLSSDTRFSEIWANAFRARRMVLLGLFVVYLTVMQSVGFLIATGAFCFITILFLSPRITATSVLTAAIVSGCTLILIYVLLVIYLQAFLP